MSSQNENSTRKETSTDSRSPEPSHNMVGRYVALMETNDTECESWYYFIKYDGNETNLNHLQEQLEKVDWHIMEDLSTFDLDLEHFVSATTAKEMTKLELNAHSFHRKFDGTLKKIDLDFRKRDSDETMICKTFDQLGYGQIEDYISDEDLDPEDLTDTEYRSSDEDESEFSDTEVSGSESSSEEEEKEHNRRNSKKKSRSRDKNTRITTSANTIPPSILNTENQSHTKKKKKLHKRN